MYVSSLKSPGMTHPTTLTRTSQPRLRLCKNCCEKLHAIHAIFSTYVCLDWELAAAEGGPAKLPFKKLQELESEGLERRQAVFVRTC